MSRAILHIFTKGKKDHEDTHADEIASYIFAGLGFYFQYAMSFDAPFPINILLFPVEFAEYYIRWAVTNDWESLWFEIVKYIRESKLFCW